MKKDFKVVGVISSARLNGNTATLVRAALRGAEENGASVTEVFLPKYKLGFCVGCLKCTATGKCPLPDGLEEIRELIYQADGIILGSPTYAMSYNAVMKCFFERLGPYTLYASMLGGKYGAGISTSYGNTSKKVAKELTGMFKFGIFERSYVTGSLGVRTMFNGIEMRVEENPDNIKKAYTLGKKMAQDIKYGNKYLLQNIPMRLYIPLFLRPFFQKSILRNKDDKERATYNSLLQKGLIKQAG